MTRQSKPIAAYGFSLFIAVWIVLSLGCCTSTVRNHKFEQAIETFVQRHQPGDSMVLFNGRDLSGWRAHGLGRWRVKDGVLSVTGGMGYLATTCNTFTDIILSLDVRVSDGGNSGVFFRARHPGFGLRPWPSGYEAQIDNHDPKNPTGSLYDLAPAPTFVVRDNEWFTMEIHCIGDAQSIFINSEKIAADDQSLYHRGFIALQGHHPSCKVEFRNIVLTLP